MLVVDHQACVSRRVAWRRHVPAADPLQAALSSSARSEVFGVVDDVSIRAFYLLDGVVVDMILSNAVVDLVLLVLVVVEDLGDRLENG